MDPSFTDIDTHCHVDLHADRAGILEQAHIAGTAIVAVTSRASEFRNLHTLLGERPDIFLGIGLHPEAAGSSAEALELEIFERELSKSDWIAEIGLDGVIAQSVGPYFGTVPSMRDQERVLEHILALPIGDRPMSLHSRGATMRLLEILIARGIGQAVFHWFHGSQEETRRILDQGYFFSVNPKMLDGSDPNGLELIKWLPDDRLLMETDGPFVTWGQQRARPADVVALADRLAELRCIDPLVLRAKIRDNFRALTGK